MNSRPGTRPTFTACTILALLLTCTACSTTKFKTGARFDPDYDFESKSTFAFRVVREKVARSPNAKYVEGALRDWLIKRGYEEVPVSSADLLIGYDIGVYSQGMISGFNTSARTEGGITIWVYDGKTNENVWYGWTEGVITPGKGEPEPTVREAIDTLFKDQIPDAR
jgi:hypothetical protein